MKKKYQVLGVMSGSSVDGLDMAYVSISLHSSISFEIHQAQTVQYPEAIQNQLLQAPSMTAKELSIFDLEYGTFIGKSCKKFLDYHKISVDFIASHGHTIFHEPQRDLTLQIGNGNAIKQYSGLEVICDFRTLDVLNGGQGAPLVPIGDELLFGTYQSCLNIGGIANISFQQGSQRISFDVCGANIILNTFSQQLGKPFDKNGTMARQGQIDSDLLKNLNQIAFFNAPPPKSIDREWVEKHILSHFSSSNMFDNLRTSVEHIAFIISQTIKKQKLKEVLITGGGAHNTFLIERIEKLSGAKIQIPSAKIIDYKEALIFALLGVLRKRNEINVYKSVTGAASDSCSGVIF